MLRGDSLFGAKIANGIAGGVIAVLSGGFSGAIAQITGCITIRSVLVVGIGANVRMKRCRQQRGIALGYGHRFPLCGASAIPKIFQRITAVEGRGIDILQRGRKGNVPQGAAEVKGVLGNKTQYLGKRDKGQGLTAVEDVLFQGFQRLGKCNVQKGGTAVKSAFPNGSKRRRESNLAQLSAAIKGIPFYGAYSIGQENLLQAFAFAEGVFTQKNQGIGNRNKAQRAASRKGTVSDGGHRGRDLQKQQSVCILKCRFADERHSVRDHAVLASQNQDVSFQQAVLKTGENRILGIHGNLRKTGASRKGTDSDGSDGFGNQKLRYGLASGKSAASDGPKGLGKLEDGQGPTVFKGILPNHGQIVGKFDLFKQNAARKGAVSNGLNRIG